MNKTRPMSVLIAEDDALINESMADQLHRLGYQLAGQAYDGPRAVELATQEKPAVVLMDLQMIDPDTGCEDPQAGLKAARTILDQYLAAVVLVTAHETPDLIRLANEAGINGYLVKPARDNDLDRAIAIGRARYDDLLELRQAMIHLQHSREQLEAALTNVKALSGLLPTCANCKKIRDDHGLWQQMEVYIEDHSEARFTHGFCPECFNKLYPGILPEGGQSESPVQ